MKLHIRSEISPRPLPDMSLIIHVGIKYFCESVKVFETENISNP